MAVTALWAVHGTHRDILDYVMNPEKTENPDYSLCKVLNYAENDEKTEKKYFVTGINCTPGLCLRAYDGNESSLRQARRHGCLPRIPELQTRGGHAGAVSRDRR